MDGNITWNFGKGEAFSGTKLFVKDKANSMNTKMKSRSGARSLTFSILIGIPFRKPVNPMLYVTTAHTAFQIASFGIKHKLFLLKECSSNIKQLQGCVHTSLT